MAMRFSSSKIKDLQELKGIVQKLQKEGKRIVFSNGCFDLLHPGHIKCLEEAKKLGDVLIVGINSDQSVKRLKGPQRPIMPLWGRMMLLGALEAVDYVVCFEEDTPLELIKELQPDVLVKGGDWKEEEVVGRELVSEVKIVEYQEGFSTTSIIEKIKRGV
jgi:D-beta-D-heptose 7-phosphate kinase/D-beta-D-heptose 1-phosphate adenosyltransferase